MKTLIEKIKKILLCNKVDRLRIHKQITKELHNEITAEMFEHVCLSITFSLAKQFLRKIHQKYNFNDAPII